MAKSSKVRGLLVIFFIFNSFVKPSVKTSAVKEDLYLALEKISVGIDVFKIAFCFTCDIKVKKFPILLKIFNYFVKPSVKTSAVKRDLYLALDKIKIK